ncbi:PREDICTED: cadherin-related family member 5-like isoform X1 [Poecilia mexicana]|uniref:cadherin-related family member 5-like isoform X1 n=1 Tax=Poecilia mexicana TaxID=48701 RepID=UPI00072DEC1D|nr:PREDICTED: cadherin-related family member 5-like isoform X1 [Poecilia mexicana]XP_014854266.1 PREDICTED: cadherin-related family member 5-like isoform X1 [Poecilia mexicana]
MALAEATLSSLLVLLSLHTVAGMSGWSECSDGQDVLAKIKENSLMGDTVAEFVANTDLKGVRWSLSGRDADWFYLDGRNIRLNTSAEKVLDQETLGPVLMAELSCYEEDMFQKVYRVMVEILNENDNLPMFSEKSVQSLRLNELTPVNAVAFTVQALDADDDKILYSIDQTSPDAEYFKIDRPNSGEVILSKPLDYETKTQLTVTIYASEMNTAEHYNTSTNVTIMVQDGDDQYPRFVPCVLLFQDETSRICTSPTYMVNVTEGEEDIVLEFSPGPIHAVDGDRGINSSISYAILSEDEGGHFSINRETGELRLMKGLKDRLLTPVVHLQVMAYQDDDPRKYSVATVLVRLLAVNQFHPEFELPEYCGFVTAGKSAASLVNTYGSRALILNVQDQDFDDGFNPMIYFSLGVTSNHTDIYQVTQSGLLIAKTSHLKPKQKHVLEVMAVDQESGDSAYSTVVVEVLPEGQLIPHSPLVNERLTGCTVGKALFLSMAFMGAIGCILSVLMWLKRKRKGMRDPLERGCVAQGKHPNVSLRWFQLVNHRTGMPHMEEVSFQNEECGTCNLSFSFPDKPDSDTTKDIPICTGPTSPTAAGVTEAPAPLPTESLQSPVILNNNASTATKISCGSPDCPPPKEDMSPTHVIDAGRPPKANADLPCDVTSGPSEEQSNTNLDPATKEDTNPSPLNEQDVETSASNNLAESAPCPSSPSSNETTSAKMDDTLPKTNEQTLSHSPPLSPPLPKETGTPPPTPEHGPLKATLVHIDTSPTDTPPDSPVGAGQTLNVEADQPSTSLDHIYPTEDVESPSPDRRPSTNSGNTFNSRGEEGEDEDGFLGDDDVDKNSEDAESDRTEFRRWSR